MAHRARILLLLSPSNITNNRLLNSKVRWLTTLNTSFDKTGFHVNDLSPIPESIVSSDRCIRLRFLWASTPKRLSHIQTLIYIWTFCFQLAQDFLILFFELHKPCSESIFPYRLLKRFLSWNFGNDDCKNDCKNDDCKKDCKFRANTVIIAFYYSSWTAKYKNFSTDLDCITLSLSYRFCTHIATLQYNNTLPPLNNSKSILGNLKVQILKRKIN